MAIADLYTTFAADVAADSGVSVRYLTAEVARLRAEVEQLRTDRETLKQTLEIMVEMAESSLSFS